MAHDDRRNAAPGCSIVAMNVAAADAACGDPDQHLAASRRRSWSVIQLQMPVLGKNKGLHLRILPQRANAPPDLKSPQPSEREEVGAAVLAAGVLHSETRAPIATIQNTCYRTL